jgi:hypothetical protein
MRQKAKYRGGRAMRFIPAICLGAACALGLTCVLAQSSGGDFELTGSTLDAGGGSASGGSFQLTGTIGQPDANAQQSSGGDFVLAGGLWASATDQVFDDGFETD